MNRSLSFVIGIFLALSVAAQERSDAEMQAIAEQHLNNSAQVKAQSSVLSRSQVCCALRQKAFSVYTPSEEDGFVFIARNERVPAIIAYGDATFDPENIPSAMRWWMESVEQNLKSDKPKVGRLLAAAYMPVPNFLTTEWSQSAPYNQRTPTIGGNHAPTGCVATAMAQAMNVFKYPPSAEFQETYYVQEGTVSTYTAKVKSTYSWDYKDTYSSSSLIQGKKIAQLMVDCGYATGMQYTAGGSGTYNFFAGRALVTHFKYPEECVKSLYRYCCTDEEWYNLIYGELMHKSPIIFGGQDAKFGGHAFVLSGIDNAGLVYVNWGWGGDFNGFYAIDLMDSPQGSFTDGQDIVYGIRTTVLPSDHIEGRISSYSGSPYTFRWGTETDKNNVEHVTLYCDLPYGFINLNATEFQGAFGLFAQDLTDGTSWVIAEELQDRDTIPSCYGYYDKSEDFQNFCFYYYVDGEQGLKPGHTYRISFGVKDDRDVRWRSIFSNVGEVGYDVTYTGDPATSTVDPEPKSVPLPTSIRSIQTSSLSSDGLTRVYDTSGRLVYAAPDAKFNLWDVPAHGILVVKQGNQVRKVVR